MAAKRLNTDSLGDLFEERATPTPAPDKSLDLADCQFKGPVLFDIETGPLPDADLADVFEFDPTKIEGYDLLEAEFDPATVKYGNTKDPLKRQEKLESEREKFAQAKAQAKARFETAEDDAFAAFKASAALDARTCQVLAIGYLDAHTGERAIDDGSGDEAQLLKTFWIVFAYARTKGIPLVGFNITGFDVPVLARRAMKHGIRLPNFRQGRYLDKTFVDLREAWGCGEYNPKGNLDSLSTFFGGPPKNGDGAHFHVLWHGTPEQRQQAIAYLENDLDMTAAVAAGLQVCTLRRE